MHQQCAYDHVGPGERCKARGEYHAVSIGRHVSKAGASASWCYQHIWFGIDRAMRHGATAVRVTR